MAEKKVTTPSELEALRAEVKRLEEALAVANTANEDAARRAMFFKDVNEEVPTGQKVTRKIAKKPWAKTEEDQEWEDVEVDTYLFKIDMPPVGGVQILLNGEALQYGETYTVDLHQLRYLKDVIFRLRDHEANIHGTDENVYRPKTNARFSGRTGGRVH